MSKTSLDTFLETAIKCALLTFSVYVVGSSVYRYNVQYKSEICEIEGVQDFRLLCNNQKRVPALAAGALYRIDDDEMACHPYKETGTSNFDVEYWNKLYIGDPATHPRARLDYALRRAETFVGAVKDAKIQSSWRKTSWQGNVVATRSTNALVDKLYEFLHLLQWAGIVG